MKDVTVVEPDGLTIAVVLESADPHDAFVSPGVTHFDALGQGATVGTSSLRRRAQLLSARPDLNITGLRGNVNTRLAKLDDGQYDAIVLAVAGLERLGMHERIRHAIDDTVCLPAVGQGIVGVQCRADDTSVLERLAPLHSTRTSRRLAAERALNAALDGGCHMPLAGYAEYLNDSTLRLRGRIGMPDGSDMLYAESEAPVESAEALGQRVAQSLLEAGAQRIIDSVAATISK